MKRPIPICQSKIARKNPAQNRKAMRRKLSVYHASLNDTPCGAKMVPKINANKITVNNSSVKTIF